jgi:uncharacterized protein (DUF2237 family)
MTAKTFSAFRNLLAVTLIGLLSFQAQAGSKDFGDYTVLWSVLPSTFLAPEVAQANDLQRSKGIGIVNIAAPCLRSVVRWKAR